MRYEWIIGLLVLAIVVPVVLFYMGERKPKRFKNMLALNIVTFFGVLLFATVFVFSGSMMAEAAPVAQKFGDNASGLAFLGAALSTGLGSIGAGLATGQAASAALGALSENEEIMGKAMIFVALAEGIAIYGLIISIMILNRV